MPCTTIDRISPPLLYQDELRRQLIITLNMSRVVQHVWEAVWQENTERLTPVFDRDHSIRSTSEIRDILMQVEATRTGG